MNGVAGSLELGRQRRPIRFQNLEVGEVGRGDFQGGDFVVERLDIALEAGDVLVDVVDAFAELKALVQSIDSMVPDAETPPVEGGGEGEGEAKA